MNNQNQIPNDNLDENDADINLFVNYASNKQMSLSPIKQVIKSHNLSKTDRKKLLKMLQGERSLSKKIARLETMKRYFKYWHVAHMPFALIMLVIVIIHIVVAFTFGYKWIF